MFLSLHLEPSLCYIHTQSLPSTTSSLSMPVSTWYSHMNVYNNHHHHVVQCALWYRSIEHVCYLQGVLARELKQWDIRELFFPKLRGKPVSFPGSVPACTLKQWYSLYVRDKAIYRGKQYRLVPTLEYLCKWTMQTKQIKVQSCLLPCGTSYM